MTLGPAPSRGDKLRALLRRDGKPLVVMHPPSAVLGRVMEATGAEAGFVGTSGVDLPLISGPVALLESGRFQGISIWPSQARLRLVQAVCSSANCAA
jgi:hypothetical protein